MRKLSLFFLVTCVLAPTVASAQERETVEFSEEQIMLNNQAVDAANAGNYKKAEQLYNAMLQIGEVNVTWMNLGAAYDKQGKCLEAAEAFARVYTAPKIAQIPAKMLEDKTDQAVRELDQKCSARVVLNCSPAETTVTIDGGREFACHGRPLSLMPGRHTVYAKTHYGFNTVVVDAVAGETQQVKVEVIDYEKVAAEAGVTPEEIQKKSTLFKALGYSFIGVGAGVAGGGGALLAVGYKDYNDIKSDYDNNLTTKDKVDDQRDKSQLWMDISYGMFAVGGAMLITGIVLVVYDAVKYQPKLREFEEKGMSWQFSPAFSPEFSGFALSATF